MQTYIFVGANSDICKATIELLNTNTDDQIVLITRDTAKLAAEFQEKYQCIDCDPCDLQALSHLFETISQQYTVTNVVNFCGTIMLKSAAMLTANDWQQTININLTTAFNVAHATTKYIKKDCHLLFFSTAAAHIGLPNHEAIAAAKAGVEGLAKSVAASYAHQNIRCNVIAPGLIQSKLTQPILKSERGKKLSLALHALDRFGEPNDIARMIVWLLDPKNNWVTGAVFRVDGGLSTTKCYPTQL